MLISGIVDRPSRMFARINTVKLTVINGDIVHVTGARHELHHLDDLTTSSVVFDQAWGVTLIADGAFLLMSGHLPDKAVVIRDSMQPFREFRKLSGARRRTQIVGLLTRRSLECRGYIRLTVPP